MTRSSSALDPRKKQTPSQDSAPSTSRRRCSTTIQRAPRSQRFCTSGNLPHPSSRHRRRRRPADVCGQTTPLRFASTIPPARKAGSAATLQDTFCGDSAALDCAMAQELHKPSFSTALTVATRIRYPPCPGGPPSAPAPPFRPERIDDCKVSCLATVSHLALPTRDLAACLHCLGGHLHRQLSGDVLLRPQLRPGRRSRLQCGREDGLPLLRLWGLLDRAVPHVRRLSSGRGGLHVRERGLHRGCPHRRRW